MPNIIQPVRNLPNGTRINGVEHIYQSTKPTTRVNGSALVVGDRWYNPLTSDEWTWNGLIWISHLLMYTFDSIASASSSLFWRFTFGEALYLESTDLILWSSIATSANYWSINFYYSESSAVITPTIPLPGNAFSNQNQPAITLKGNRVFNFLLPVTTTVFSVQLDRIGSPSNAVCGGVIKYRRVQL